MPGVSAQSSNGMLIACSLHSLSDQGYTWIVHVKRDLVFSVDCIYGFLHSYMADTQADDFKKASKGGVNIRINDGQNTIDSGYFSIQAKSTLEYPVFNDRIK